jgi:hypothetical protein
MFVTSYPDLLAAFAGFGLASASVTGPDLGGYEAMVIAEDGALRWNERFPFGRAHLRPLSPAPTARMIDTRVRRAACRR